MKSLKNIMLFFIALPSLASANLVNGSFESPDLGGDLFRLYPAGSNAISNWNIIGGETDITARFSSFIPSDGNQFIDLSAAGGYNKGLQTYSIDVNPYTWYTLTFDIGSYTDNGAFISSTETSHVFGTSVNVSFSDGQSSPFVFSDSRAHGLDVNWGTMSFDWFSGNNGSTQITFLTVDPGNLAKPGYNYWNNGFLDNVKFDVAPVPVPAAVWLFGTGFFGLLGFRKKRVKK